MMAHRKGFILRLRNNHFLKHLMILMAFLVIISGATPSFGLTDGPTQPETQRFEYGGLQQLVNPFTGGFAYSIPLFSVGPYPFELTYNSDITMEQEASWVGLGWNLNTGCINRNMRGFPDDFSKDTVTEERNQKKNYNVAVNLRIIDPELFTIETPDLTKNMLKSIFDSLRYTSASAGITFIYNNYNGLSFSRDISFGLNLTSNTFHSLQSSVGFSTGDGGLTISPSLSFDKMNKNNIKNSLFSYGSLGFSFNSLKGIQHMNFGIYSNKLGLSGMNNELAFPPYTSFPFRNSSFSFVPKTGFTAVFSDIGISIGVNYGIQKLAVNKLELPAYGYLYMNGKNGSSGELLDFSREKDNTYMPGNPYLPQTFLQPDIFSVNTPVLSDDFRAYQNESQVVSSPYIFNTSEQTTVDFGIEFGGGSATDFGGNLSLFQTYSTSGLWIEKNSAGTGSTPSNFARTTPFPNVYFKSLNTDARSPLSSISSQPEMFPVSGNGFQYALGSNTSVYNSKYNSIISVREKTVFKPLTKETISRHPLYSALYLQYESDKQKAHHIAAVKIKDDSGNTLMFACPAMNNLQKDVSFMVEGSGDYSSMYINYTDIDASKDNERGMTGFFSSRTLPAYAYAYMLTDLYTAEYSDLTGDGPTPDDPGDYVLFSYAKKIANYKWRTPYTEAEYFAAYNPNLRTQKGARSDDLASYSYGKKDIWYVDTVRSKHQMAVFYTSPRHDAREAKGEKGGKGPRAMHRLDSVRVYNIHNYYQAKQQLITPIPDKRIIFRYDYSLCKGVYNQTGSSEGKLTLQEVIITDYNTNSGFRHSHTFSYSPVNPGYSPMQVDRWGNYDPTSPAGMNNQEFPYTTSGDTVNASAWRLSQITLPSGGKISVEYEQGNYSYVQDMPAMQMFQLAGASASPGSIGNELHNGSTGNDNYLFFETDISPGLSFAKAQLEFHKYFDDAVLKNLYFKIFTNIGTASTDKEEVFGFAEIEKHELVLLNNKYYGRIKLKGVPIGRKSNSAKVNPVTKAAIHFGMINTPRLTYGHADLNQYLNQPLVFLNHFLQEYIWNTGFINNFITTIQGAQKRLYHQNIGRFIDPFKSYIRLKSASAKPGGGSRVKKVKYENSWNVMSPGEAGSSLVKEYIYQHEDGTSSGVASYEPQTGADEIPLHLPYTYQYTTKQHKLATWARNLVPHIDYLGIQPLCETAYPSPVVGYARVVETTKAVNGVTDGKVIYEFNTTKEYPTRVYASPLQEKNPIRNMDAVFVSIEKNHSVVSQGFTFVTNNMNGKEKKVEYYDSQNRLLKRIVNHYSLSGSCSFYHDNNAVSQGYKGLEKDVVVDLREEAAYTSGRKMLLNSNTTVVPIPLGIITALGGYIMAETIFRSATVTTGIYQHACLIRQEIEDRGADLSVRNVYHDPATGRPLVTQITNKWGKKTWNYELPAYFVYMQMGIASGLTGHRLNISTNSEGRIISATPVPLSDGDKIIVTASTSKYAWVMKAGNYKYLIDQDGQPVASLQNAAAYLWESGRRNLLNPVAQSITSKEFPVASGQQLIFNETHGILSSAAVKYNDYYSYPCAECGCTPSYINDSIPVMIPAKSPQPVYIPFTIKIPCTCNGMVTLFPSDNTGLFFYWPGQNRWGTYVQNLCENQDVQVNIYTDTSGSPISSYTFHIPIPPVVDFTFQQPLNPYVHKLKNYWAPSESYVFLTSRTPEQTSDAVTLPQQGEYKNFAPFWYYSSGWKNNHLQWLLAEKSTYEDFAGNPAESRNIINTYSAATYSHKGFLSESITSDARNNEVGCDAFEDYHPFYNTNGQQPWQHRIGPQSPEHFRLAKDYVSLVTLEKPHTGYYSLKIPSGTTITKTVLSRYPLPDSTSIPETAPPFMVQPVHCADVFAPTPGKKYHLSFWYNKEDTSLSGLQFTIFYENAQIYYTIDYLSPVIEGWRQFACSFELTGRQCGSLSFMLKNASQQNVFVDDFRVHPWQARMNHYVYNPFTHQLMSVLDENNFALMYQYDALQQVQNTIKETEKGRMFLQYRIKHMFEKQ
jgi:hypothetical protein